MWIDFSDLSVTARPMRASRTLGLNTVGLFCQAKDLWPNAYCLESLVQLRRCGCDDGASRLRRRFQTSSLAAAAPSRFPLPLVTEFNTTKVAASKRTGAQARINGTGKPALNSIASSPTPRHVIKRRSRSETSVYFDFTVMHSWA